MSRTTSRLHLLFITMLSGFLAGCNGMSFPRAGGPPRSTRASHTYLIHVPGMGGWVTADTDWLRGLEEGGASDRIEVYDWPPPYFLLGAVQAYDHTRAQARYLAEKITEKLREDPQARIVLTAWSAGAAVTIWALEELPDDLQVQSVLLMQAGIDPDHDLSRALGHVRGHMFSMYSGGDFIVLGLGTMIFGTADGGILTAAAGQTGFRKPPGYDPAEYKKLVEIPYQFEWIKYGDFGEHVSQMSRSLAKEVLGPMLVGDGEVKSSP
jgi:hypothetical protein